jgi:hypothetical protein
MCSKDNAKACYICSNPVGTLLACIADDRERAMYKAAPDLLAALKDAEGWLNDSDIAYVISHDKGEQSAYCRMMVAIHAALAKAEGGR